jgi:hypothetical protein
VTGQLELSTEVACPSHFPFGLAKQLKAGVDKIINIKNYVLLV